MHFKKRFENFFLYNFKLIQSFFLCKSNHHNVYCLYARKRIRPNKLRFFENVLLETRGPETLNLLKSREN